MEASMTMAPIGEVRQDEAGAYVEIETPYRDGLSGLGDFGHAYVFWWAARYDIPEVREMLRVPLPYADGREVGVFACRAPVRPNLLMSTLCEIESVDDAAGVVRVVGIDAFPGTPVLDLKPYYGLTDRVRQPREPEYLTGWPEWFPAEGITLMEGEE
jgi:tRNA (adenine37-N6)-methyltransferase